MTWFKVDDSFYDHPKVFDAPDCAVALWTRAGSWCARNLTDGFVPAAVPARLCGDSTTAVAELVHRGLWSRTRGGYQFHDWTEYQPTKEKVTQERKANAERQARHRAKRNGNGNALLTRESQDPDPTRPPLPKGSGRVERAALRDGAARSPAWADDPCQHGQPGGYRLTADGEPLCPLCRKETDLSDDFAEESP